MFAVIVFLDIDGVLNSSRWRPARRPGEHPRAQGIDPAAVRLLDPLVAAGIKFVLSSTWREFYDGPGMTRMLSVHGFRGEVIDRTKLDPHQCGPGGLYSTAETRGQQVFEWVEAHPDCGPFVIFDDDGGAEWWSPVEHRLIQTDFEIGLQPQHVERALAMLTTP